MHDDEDLRYPIGRAPKVDPEAIAPDALAGWISDIERTPERVQAAVRDLNDEQLDMPYRTGGWTVRQVVHHLLDSHINSYCRYRLALTEDYPLITAYREADWAELADAKHGPIAPSLTALAGLHIRWTALLKSLSPREWARGFRHPERGPTRLDQATALYSWHGRHHVGHILSLRDGKSW